MISLIQKLIFQGKSIMNVSQSKQLITLLYVQNGTKVSRNYKINKTLELH